MPILTVKSSNKNGILKADALTTIDGAKPTRPLTRKQQNFVNALLDNPKTTPTAAARLAYNAKDTHSAGQIAQTNMKKPEIIMALGNHVELAESTIVGTMRDWQKSEAPRQREIALSAATYLHDKVFGRATSRVEVQASVVKIAINLSGDGEEAPKELLDS